MILALEKGDTPTKRLILSLGKISLLCGSANCNGFDDAMWISCFAKQCQNISGVPVEFGCYDGRTAALISGVMDKQIWVYDSFEGLPPQSPADKNDDDDFYVGQFACSPMDVLDYFKKQNLKGPIVRCGWFDSIPQEDLPGAICFAHLDGDYHDSILQSLELVYPRLSKGAICLIHDYNYANLPGARLAVDSFMRDKPERVVSMPGELNGVASHGHFIKL